MTSDALKRFTRAEVSAKKDGKETWFVIDNLVYEVTAFLDEHPGGHEVLVNVAGNDASEDFEDVGHSLDAKELMKKYCVGELVEEEKIHKQKRTHNWQELHKSSENNFLSSWKFPVVVGLLLTIVYSYLFG